MSRSKNSRNAPKGLGKSGLQLWRSLIADAEGSGEWELDARDIALLTDAARIADHVEELEALVAHEGTMIEGSRKQRVLHPALIEARQQRQLMMTMLGKIEMAPPEPKTGGLSKRQRDQLRDARKARWS